MANIGDDLFRPIVRALDDAAVNLRPLRDMVDGLKAKQLRNRDGVTDIDRAPDAPDVPPSSRGDAGSGRDDGRDDRGRFVGDGNRPWVDREQTGLDNVADREGVEVIRDQVASRHPSTGGQVRYFDGLFQNADGTYTGIEVKSGSAGRNAAQRLFDGAISVETPAIAHLPNVGQIRIVQVILERVP